MDQVVTMSDDSFNGFSGSKELWLAVKRLRYRSKDWDLKDSYIMYDGNVYQVKEFFDRYIRRPGLEPRSKDFIPSHFMDYYPDRYNNGSYDVSYLDCSNTGLKEDVPTYKLLHIMSWNNYIYWFLDAINYEKNINNLSGSGDGYGSKLCVDFDEFDVSLDDLQLDFMSNNMTSVSNVSSDDVCDIVTIDAQVESRSKKTEYKHAVIYDNSQLVYQDRVGTDLELDTDKESGDDITKDYLTSDRREFMIKDLHSISRYSNPDSIRLVVDDELGKTVESGDRIRVSAIVFRENDETKNSDLYLYAVGIQNQDDLDLSISQDDVDTFEQTAQNNDMLEFLSSKICPDLVGEEHHNIRKAVALQLMSGGFDNMDNRDNSHILLGGDPSVGKSQYLEWVDDIHPTSYYSSGKNTSGVGLTGSVERVEDFDSNEWTVSAGVLPKSDGGIACIDELDKMDKNAQKSLNLPLSQQRVEINKASINVSLNSRTSVLAACNPKSGRIDAYEDEISQLDFHSSLFARFDFIFILSDRVDANEGDKIERIIENRQDNKNVNKEYLSKYIEYARDEYDPSMSDDAYEQLAQRATELRVGSDDDREQENDLRVTYRYIDALERLARSHARLQLREEVVTKDVDVAYELVRDNLESLGVFDDSSSIDIDSLEGGYSGDEREFLDMVEQYDSRSTFISKAISEFGKSKLNSIKNKMKEKGEIYEQEDDDIIRRIDD